MSLWYTTDGNNSSCSQLTENPKLKFPFLSFKTFHFADSKAESKMWSNSHVVLLEKQMKRIARDSNLLNLISWDPYGAISTSLRLVRD